MNELDHARRHRLIVALLTERDNDAAFAAAGIPKSTAYRWLKTKEFQLELAAEAQAMLGQGNALLRSAYVDAVRTLVDLMQNSQSETVRMRAAATLVSNANQKAVQDEATGAYVELAQRLQELIRKAPKEVKQYFKDNWEQEA